MRSVGWNFFKSSRLIVSKKKLCHISSKQTDFIQLFKKDEAETGTVSLKEHVPTDKKEDFFT